MLHKRLTGAIKPKLYDVFNIILKIYKEVGRECMRFYYTMYGIKLLLKILDI